MASDYTMFLIFAIVSIIILIIIVFLDSTYKKNIGGEPDESDDPILQNNTEQFKQNPDVMKTQESSDMRKLYVEEQKVDKKEKKD